MQRFSQRSTVLLFTIFALIAGCAAKIQKEVVESTLEQARLNIQAIEEVEDASQLYPNDIQEARSKYDEAKKSFQEGKIDKSYLDALASLTISQRIVEQIYSHIIEPSVQMVKAEIESKIAQDPSTPLKDFIPELNKILERTEKIKAGQQPPSLAEFLNDFTGIEQIKTITRQDERKTLAGDVSFAKGKYELSEEGKIILQGVAQNIIALIEERTNEYHGRTIFVKITVSGYTDQLGFHEGTDLVRELLEGVTEPIPQKGTDERRKLLNRRLSEFRARTISEHLREIILTAKQGLMRLKIELEIIGLGEKTPEDVLPPYPKEDARRRICRIYRYVSAR